MDVDAALSEVPVNILPLLDDTDFKSIEGAVAYNAAGMALRWHFVTCAGAYTVTSVTPTTAGNYDWTDQGDSGIYTIEIPASGGASINNDTEGFGWFTGVATGVLPWRGPTIGFRAAGLNDALIESAYSTTRGLAGTALPAAAADAAGGLPISDAGGLDLDAQVGTDIDNLVSRIGVPSNLGGGATVAANLSDIEGQTDDIGTAGAGLTNIPWNASWDAEVQSEVNDGLVAYDAATGADVSAVETDTQDIQIRLPAALDGGRMNSSVNNIDAAQLTSLAAAVWNRLTSLLSGAGSIGKLIVDNLNATVSSRATQTSVDDVPTNAELTTALGTLNNLSQAQAQTAAAAALTAYDPPTHAELTTALASGVALTSAAVDAIHDEVIEGSITHRQSMRLANAANAGKTNGAGTGTFNIRDLADSKNRIVASTDGTGNRTAITTDVT